jgi:succinate dehydrogenase / fumarate reductase, flavoprotein subunit
MKSHIKCDVLVIGSGGAGLRTAIECHDKKQNVLIVGKSKRGDAHTILARGGINAALKTMDPKDSWQLHAADTLKDGLFLADHRFVVELCKNAPAAVKEIVKWGARFAKKKNGQLEQRFFGAHTYRRTCFYGDWTGKEIIRVLLEQTKKRKIKLESEVTIVKLITKKNRVIGALGIDLKNGKKIIIAAKSIVLATGGHSKAYRVSSSRPFENHGDGVSLGFDVGVPLIDMEMIQFHPTGMVFPKEMEGTLVTEAVRAEGGLLTNKMGERYMQKYDPDRMELSARDIVALSNYKEILAGRGTTHRGVYLDISHKSPAYIKRRLPTMYSQFRGVGLDITKQRMEVAPTAHYSMGGILTGLKGETGVKGLYAIGEVTGDVHGANRLGGNSLVELLVFGKIVGTAATAYAQKRPVSACTEGDCEEALAWLNAFTGKGKKYNIKKIRSQIQETMTLTAGLVKKERELKAGLKKIWVYKKQLHTGKVANWKQLIVLLDTLSIVTTAELIVRGALLRKESRGAHYRSDYPKTASDVRRIVWNNRKGMPIHHIERNPPIPSYLKKAIVRARAVHHLLE